MIEYYKTLHRQSPLRKFNSDAVDLLTVNFSRYKIAKAYQVYVILTIISYMSY